MIDRVERMRRDNAAEVPDAPIVPVANCAFCTLPVYVAIVLDVLTAIHPDCQRPYMTQMVQALREDRSRIALLEAEVTRLRPAYQPQPYTYVQPGGTVMPIRLSDGTLLFPSVTIPTGLVTASGSVLTGVSVTGTASAPVGVNGMYTVSLRTDI